MTQHSQPIKEVTVDEAKELMTKEKVILLDIRSAMDYEVENISGAQHIASQEEFDSFVSSTDKESTIICYCYFGNSSLGACAALQEHGFENSYSLTGGFDAWKNTTA